MTGETYKDIAEKELNVPEQTVWNWIYRATRTSETLRQLTQLGKLAQGATRSLLKYSHEVQDLLATFIVDWNDEGVG